PGALDDPLVGGVDALFEVGVRESLLGDGDAPTRDAGAHRQAKRSQATGWPSRSRSPGWTSIPASLPRDGLHTGVDVQGPSRRPMGRALARGGPSPSSSTGRNTPTVGATIMRSGTRSPSPWVNRASMRACTFSWSRAGVSGWGVGLGVFGVGTLGGWA